VIVTVKESAANLEFRNYLKAPTMLFAFRFGAPRSTFSPPCQVICIAISTNVGPLLCCGCSRCVTFWEYVGGEGQRQNRICMRRKDKRIGCPYLGFYREVSFIMPLVPVFDSVPIYKMSDENDCNNYR